MLESLIQNVRSNVIKMWAKEKKCAERFSDLLKDLIISFEKNKAFVQLKSQLFTELTMKIDIRQLEHLITVQVLIHCNHEPPGNHTTLSINDRYLFFWKHWSNLFSDLSIFCFQVFGNKSPTNYTIVTLDCLCIVLHLQEDGNFPSYTSLSICKIKCRSFQFLIRLTNSTP